MRTKIVAALLATIPVSVVAEPADLPYCERLRVLDMHLQNGAEPEPLVKEILNRTVQSLKAFNPGLIDTREELTDGEKWFLFVFAGGNLLSHYGNELGDEALKNDSRIFNDEVSKVDWDPRTLHRIVVRSCL